MIVRLGKIRLGKNRYLFKSNVHVAVEACEDTAVVNSGVELDDDGTTQQVLEEGRGGRHYPGRPNLLRTEG
jgi:hypothetical protein